MRASRKETLSCPVGAGGGASTSTPKGTDSNCPDGTTSSRRASAIGAATSANSAR
jgi:hypothetical protein